LRRPLFVSISPYRVDAGKILMPRRAYREQQDGKH
jgi:hypothetical protein